MPTFTARCCQDVLRRLDTARQAFFRRVKEGQKPGYPRFQGRTRYDSLTFPPVGFALAGDRLTLAKIGDMKVRLHRPSVGQVKTCTIKRDADHWYVTFSCEVQEEPLPPCAQAVGLDLGLLHVATLSTGEPIENPRHSRKGQKKLALAQQKLSRCKRGSHRRERARKTLARPSHGAQPAAGLASHKTARSRVEPVRHDQHGRPQQHQHEQSARTEARARAGRRVSAQWRGGQGGTQQVDA
jgi:putative transposase